MYDFIKSLINEGKEPDGTYVGVRLTQESKSKVRKIAKEINVPNIVPSKKMHITLIYSRKYLPEFSSHGKLDKPIVAEVDKLHVFQKEGGPRVLTIKLKSPELERRHKEIMDGHGATYDFDEYIPHLTLSYNCGNYDEEAHDIRALLGDSLEIDEEYDQELDLNWA